MPLLVVILLCSVMAASAAVPDTTVYTARPVAVEDVTPTATSTGLPMTSWTTAMLDRVAPFTIQEALSLTPGVSMRQYGGPATPASISLRGGSAAQSLVLIDGIRWSTTQNGQADIGALPTSVVSSVEVIRGGASALYGANAMTGVTSITLRSPHTTSARVMVTGASFEEYRMALSGSAMVGSLGMLFAADVQSARGAFPMQVDQYGTTYELSRENSDAHVATAMFRAGEANRWSIVALGRSLERGVPGAVVQGSIANAQARYGDDDLLVGATGHITISPNTALDLTLGTRYREQRYKDPLATFTGVEGLDETFLLRDLTLGGTSTTTLQDLLLRMHVEYSNADLRGGSLQPDVDDDVDRQSVGLSMEAQWAMSNQRGRTLTAALRGDVYSDVGSAISPLLGLRWEFSDAVDARASASYNFRPPSFSELYYLNYGTTTLRPERAVSVDAGATIHALSSDGITLNLDVDAFSISTTDLIISIPITPVMWSAQNVGAASSIGFDLSGTAHLFKDLLMVHGSYTLQDVRDRTGRAGLDGTLIPYIPQELFSGGLHCTADLLRTGITFQYSSFRYALPGGDASSVLRSYGTASIYAAVIAATDVVRSMIRLQCDNAFDAQYVIVRGFPMPGRMIRVMVEATWQ
jgi:outer membrane cobalamin receptor